MKLLFFKTKRSQSEAKEHFSNMKEKKGKNKANHDRYLNSNLFIETLLSIQHIAILVQFKVVKLELISKSRHPLFQLVTFLCWSHILTSAYISKYKKFSQTPSPEVEEDLGETETN